MNRKRINFNQFITNNGDNEDSFSGSAAESKSDSGPSIQKNHMLDAIAVGVAQMFGQASSPMSGFNSAFDSPGPER